jgi:hypothetical protein
VAREEGVHQLGQPAVGDRAHGEQVPVHDRAHETVDGRVGVEPGRKISASLGVLEDRAQRRASGSVEVLLDPGVLGVDRGAFEDDPDRAGGGR